MHCRADRGHHGGLKRPWPLSRGGMAVEPCVRCFPSLRRVARRTLQASRLCVEFPCLVFFSRGVLRSFCFGTLERWRSVLGWSRSETPPVVTVRGYLEGIRRLMKGDCYVGRGGKQRGLKRSHPPYCCASFPCDSGLRSSLSTFSVSPLSSTGGNRFFFPFPWWRFGTLGFQRNFGGGVLTRAADVVWWWCVDGSIQRDASQQLVYSFPVLYWFVASRQLCWLRRMGSVGVRCHGRDSLSSLVDVFSWSTRISRASQ